LIYFLDASALVKRYIREPGSDVVRSLGRKRRLAASRISAVEVAAALWRRSREGDVTAAAVRSCLARLAADLVEIDIVEPRGAVLDIAAELVSRHPLRAYDAVQLASALRLARSTRMALTFACADAKLCTVAARERVRSLRVG